MAFRYTFHSIFEYFYSFILLFISPVFVRNTEECFAQLSEMSFISELCLVPSSCFWERWLVTSHSLGSAAIHEPSTALELAIHAQSSWPRAEGATPPVCCRDTPQALQLRSSMARAALSPFLFCSNRWRAQHKAESTKEFAVKSYRRVDEGVDHHISVCSVLNLHSSDIGNKRIKLTARPCCSAIKISLRAGTVNCALQAMLSDLQKVQLPAMREATCGTKYTSCLPLLSAKYFKKQLSHLNAKFENQVPLYKVMISWKSMGNLFSVCLILFTLLQDVR